ncbi:hypothetical protein PHLGIDRAFT_73964 [Phlebiopsis gigantea 11061_1 CR5-6]|uniref:3'-5' exonuclease domain-containing protein n=1 Tax=Phlebiopsis gigantea (strain 11061_1 CR5-6) TaxID=745531 RepID=A0A0C3NKU4_PHLG1|nr:hypothetical protein PHLGIDRAFT_73964 [Phlebiopsis gigantea 11061_1 CR5-6]
MALQALKETKHSAARCRLSPPGSPSKRTASSSSAATSKPQPFKSKLLAALDAEMENVRSVPHATYQLSTSAAASQRLPPKASPAAPMHSVASILTPGPLEPPPKVRKKTTMPPPPISMDQLALLAEESIAAVASSKAAVLPPKEHVVYSYKDYSPEPAVVYTRHEEEANELVACLRGPLGLDMEWRVMFNRGAGRGARRTALVQLCDKPGLIVCQELIENPAVVKAGANILNDGRKLFNDFGIHAANLVELSALAREVDQSFTASHTRRIVSLAEMVRCYCDEKVLEKGDVRTGNWEAAPLNDEQKKYAANDVHSGLMVALRLYALAEQQARTLDASTFTSAVPAFAAAGPGEAAPSAAAEDDAETVSGGDPADALCPPPRRQHMRAYSLWHRERKALDGIRAALRTKENPLAASTVVSYVIWALQADASLPYSMPDLIALVQLEIGSWARHRGWILKQDPKGRP